MNKHNSMTEIIADEKERCDRCGKVFRSDSTIIAVYGKLFCSDECVFEEFPDLDENDLETILASDIGVK